MHHRVNNNNKIKFKSFELSQPIIQISTTIILHQRYTIHNKKKILHSGQCPQRGQKDADLRTLVIIQLCIKKKKKENDKRNACVRVENNK